MKNYPRLFVLVIFIFVVAAAHAQPQQPHPAPQGIFSRLIEIKYTAELFLSRQLKNEGNIGNKDSALAIYNTLRLQVDGFIFSLSGDMIAANSPRKLRLLNEWCLAQNDQVNIEPTTKKQILNTTLSFSELDAFYKDHILSAIYSNARTLNLTTNVFYLLKDSYTIVKGLTDLKTQKTMALVELLDNCRLLSPGELGKAGK